jgi:hypothetical protein
MGLVIRMPERQEGPKATAPRLRAAATEQRFRYPGPDVVSEVSCQHGRRRTRRDGQRPSRRA